MKTSNDLSQQRFSLRKSKAFGMVSCLLGLFIVLSLTHGTVHADEFNSESSPSLELPIPSNTQGSDELPNPSASETMSLGDSNESLDNLDSEKPLAVTLTDTVETRNADSETNITDSPEIDKSQLTVAQTVKVEGVVASDLGKWGGEGFYLQLDNQQGIYVYPGKNDLGDLTLQKGDRVNFTATVGEFNKNLQLVKLEDINVISKDHDVLVTPTTVPSLTKELVDRQVELTQLTVTEVKSQGKYKNTIIKAVDKNGQTIEVFADNRATGQFDDVSKVIQPNSQIISVKGFVSLFKDKYQLKLVDLSEIVISKDNKVELSDEVTDKLKVETIGVIQGASHTSPLVGKEVVVSNVVVTKIDDKKGFYIQDITPDQLSETSDAIYVSSKDKVAVGDQLTVEGLVVESYGLGYKEKEQTDLTITQLMASKIIKEGTANLPRPILLGDNIPKNTIDDDGLTQFEPKQDAIDFWESLEGMRVEVANPQILGPQKYGNLYVLPEGYRGERNNANGISLRPEGQNTEVIALLISNRNYLAKANDAFSENLIGTITYDYSEYKVDLRGLNLPQKVNGDLKREASTIVFDDNKLTIASYNIENFSANPTDKETPEEKVEKIAKSFIHEIEKPDIVTLIEVQDNNGSQDNGVTSGVDSGHRLANKIKELGGPVYQYVEIAPENNADGGKPGANIRVAFLYNPERVSLPQKAIADTNEAAVFVNGELAKNPARIAPNHPAFKGVRKSLALEFDFKGEKVIVIANHLKSKNGDNPLYGKVQPAVEHSKMSRIAQARVLNEFVKSGLAQNPNLKFVLTGDFNDFEFSETIKAAEGKELVNLLSRHHKEDRYTYFYRGNNQSLDNILVSKNLLDNIAFDVIHVNSSFMEEHGRASDHDPLIVQLDFNPFIKKTETEVPKTPSLEEDQPTSNITAPSSHPNKETMAQQNMPTDKLVGVEHYSKSDSEEVTDVQTSPVSDKQNEFDKSQVMKMPSSEKFLPKTGEASYLGTIIGLVSLVAGLGVAFPHRKKD